MALLNHSYSIDSVASSLWTALNKPSMHADATFLASKIIISGDQTDHYNNNPARVSLAVIIWATAKQKPAADE